MINVSRCFLPDRDKYKKYIDDIFDSGRLTNRGPLCISLERRLESFLGVDNLLLVANGTLALQVAYRVLALKGDVVTTPFSFAATTSSLVWLGLQPVFADICPRSFNIAPENIEKAITRRTSAILPVHVFGNACRVDEISDIAKRYRIKTIYDGAHAFNVVNKINGKSLLSYGDVSTVSFHATKLFHTIEGGAIILKDRELLDDARAMVNFGIGKDGTLGALGINAKMSEIHAAMGHCILDDVEKIFDRRRVLVELYRTLLTNMVTFQEWSEDFSTNYSYFPIVLGSVDETAEVTNSLQREEIYPRRYFSPSLDEVYSIGQKMVVSRDLSSRILCLPLFPEMTIDDVSRISAIVIQALQNCRS